MNDLDRINEHLALTAASHGYVQFKRVPAGSSKGGQFTSKSTGKGGATGLSKSKTRTNIRQSDGKAHTTTNTRDTPRGTMHSGVKQGRAAGEMQTATGHKLANQGPDHKSEIKSLQRAQAGDTYGSASHTARQNRISELQSKSTPGSGARDGSPAAFHAAGFKQSESGGPMRYQRDSSNPRGLQIAVFNHDRKAGGNPEVHITKGGSLSPERLSPNDVKHVNEKLAATGMGKFQTRMAKPRGRGLESPAGVIKNAPRAAGTTPVGVPGHRAHQPTIADRALRESSVGKAPSTIDHATAPRSTLVAHLRANGYKGSVSTSVPNLRKRVKDKNYSG